MNIGDFYFMKFKQQIVFRKESDDKKSEILVLFVTSTLLNKKKTAHWEGVSKEFKNHFKSEESLVGAFKELTFFRGINFKGYQHILIAGLGESQKITHESLREISGKVIKTVKSFKIFTIDFDLNSALHFYNDTDNKKAALQALTEGILLGQYESSLFKSKKEEKEFQIFFLGSKSQSDLFSLIIKKVSLIAETINFSRYLGDAPANKMTPRDLAHQTRKAASKTGLKVSIKGKEWIKKEKMEAFLSVAKGSSEPPQFIIMEYRGTSSTKKPICLVGKGLTFDSGGISIKPSQSMEEMKYDMCGGANVIGAMLVIAQLKLKINAIGFVPATENMPGPAATKPGDIVEARNGKTIEINNTDAEGRLILADALSYASSKKPICIIDMATLTGAMSVALGNIYTGFFTKNEDLSKRIFKAAELSGEKVWQMPLCEAHLDDIKGSFGDLSNISSGKGAGSSIGAAFLEQFVDEDIPWAHFDIAGTAWNTSNRLSYCPKGATGVMIRTLVEFAKSFENK